MSPSPTRITFFERLLPLVTSGRKTITIRDASESHYAPGSLVQVFPLEQQHSVATSCVCQIIIDSVEPIAWESLHQGHADQEGMPLDELKRLLGEIYPNNKEQLFVISYHLAAAIE